MKKIFKIAIILILAIMIQIQFNFVYANGLGQDKLDDIEKRDDSSSTSKDWSGGYDVNQFDPSKDTTPDSTYGLQAIGKSIASVIRNIGIVIAVISLMIIGLRTMVGSMEEKAAYKQSLPGYLLGVFMVVAISCLPSIIYEIMKSLNS